MVHWACRAQRSHQRFSKRVCLSSNTTKKPKGERAAQARGALFIRLPPLYSLRARPARLGWNNARRFVVLSKRTQGLGHPVVK